MEAFIYVFTAEARDRLLRLGYSLLRSDDKAHTYVFANRKEQLFSAGDFGFVLSSTMTY